MSQDLRCADTAQRRGIRPTTIATLVAACLLVPACTTAPATGQPEGNPGSTQLNQRERQELNRKLETYVEGFCGAVVQFAQPVRGFVADTGSPDKLVSSLRSFLDKMTAASATAASELAQLDPSVVPDADRPIEQFRQGLKATELLLARLRTKTDEIDPNDQAALRTFLTGFSVEIKNISTGGASVDSLSVNPELRAAADKTPVCLEAQGVGPSGDVDASAVPTS